MNKNKTFVPGIYREMADELRAEETEVIPQSNQRYSQIIKLQPRRLVGILFSISGHIHGEIFPVYLGRNIYGSDHDCDICLRETSVSGKHGVLLTRSLSDPQSGKDFIKITISDNESEYGTFVNHHRLVGETPLVQNGDIISIGGNYDFILTIFDHENKLSPNESFQPLPHPETGLKTSECHSDFNRPVEEGKRNEQSLCPHDEHEEIQKESPLDFYKPTKKTGNDPYNSQTIIL